MWFIKASVYSRSVWMCRCSPPLLLQPSSPPFIHPSIHPSIHPFIPCFLGGGCFLHRATSQPIKEHQQCRLLWHLWTLFTDTHERACFKSSLQLRSLNPGKVQNEHSFSLLSTSHSITIGTKTREWKRGWKSSLLKIQSKGCQRKVA